MKLFVRESDNVIPQDTTTLRDFSQIPRLIGEWTLLLQILTGKKSQFHMRHFVRFGTFTKSNTTSWVLFTLFKLCKWYQIARSITYSMLYLVFPLFLLT